MDAVRMLTTGRHITRYDENGGKEVFLFYKPEGRIGALYWCPPGKLDESPNRRMPLEELTDIYGS